MEVLFVAAKVIVILRALRLYPITPFLVLSKIVVMAIMAETPLPVLLAVDEMALQQVLMFKFTPSVGVEEL